MKPLSQYAAVQVFVSSFMILGLWVLVFKVVPDDFSGTPDFVVLCLLQLFVYWLARYGLAPWAARNCKGRLLLFLGIYVLQLVVVLVFLLIISVLSGAMKWVGAGSSDLLNLWPILLVISTPCVLGAGMYVYMWALGNEQQKVRKKIEIKRLQKSMKEAELRLAEQPITAHFLTNTLAVIRHMLRTGDRRTTEALGLVIQMMKDYVGYFRYKTIPLRDEIEQVKRMIKLFELRQGAEIMISVRSSPAVVDQQVFPMLLICLIENMYKYGVITDSTKAAEIVVSRTKDGRLTIEASNYCAEDWPPEVQSMGRGLRFLEERIDYFYPYTGEMRYGRKGDLFYVKIAFGQN